MKDTSGTKVLGRTSAKRLGLVLVPALVGAGALSVMMADGALAASFGVSGQTFHLTATSLTGTDFAQFGSTDTIYANGKVIPVAISAFKTATINGLCQSVQTPVPAVGTVWLSIKASSATAVNLVIDMQQLNAGSADFTNINIGQDASTLSAAQGAPGLFGQQADVAKLTNVDQVANSTNAGDFTLNGMSLALQVGGDDPCGGS
ncbi:MAG TPA: DUF6230 family protein [Actinocrinis sp.]|nr:DUF6230 family protein [Actinocrinis sp.]